MNQIGSSFTPKTKAPSHASITAEHRNPIDVFVVSASDPGRYTWQIRQFGAFVIQDTLDTYDTVEAARAAGRVVLGD